MVTSEKKKLVRYPWDRWLKRKRFKLIRGVHFNCMPHSMSVQVRSAAFNRGQYVSVKIIEDVLDVRVTK